MNETPKNIGIEAATRKIKHYCAYQERCHAEVKEKLYSFGLYSKEVDEIISLLIQEGYLNEERYAIAFAGGKFRMNKWGKTKIIAELKKKKVSPYCINKGINQIDEDDYMNTLSKLCRDKFSTMKSRSAINTKKVTTYLLGKGYDYRDIATVLKQKDFE